MKRNSITAYLMLFSSLVYSQVGINTANPAAALDITSTNDGILIPRVALLSTSSLSTSSGTIITPTASELVYNTATVADVTPGFYYLNPTATGWIRLGNDNLGNHSATTALNMNSNNITNANIVQAATNLSLNPTSGNVGIGTNAPAQKLTVAGGETGNIGMDNSSKIMAKNTSGTYEDVLYGRATDNGTYINGGTGGITLRTDNGIVTNQYLGINGNTGMGTITPQRRLHVTGGLQVTNEINVGGNATTAGSAGTAGQYLMSNGAGAAPTWQRSINLANTGIGDATTDNVNGTAWRLQGIQTTPTGADLVTLSTPTVYSETDVQTLLLNTTVPKASCAFTLPYATTVKIDAHYNLEDFTGGNSQQPYVYFELYLGQGNTATPTGIFALTSPDYVVAGASPTAASGHLKFSMSGVIPNLPAGSYVLTLRGCVRYNTTGSSTTTRTVAVLSTNVVVTY